MLWTKKFFLTIMCFVALCLTFTLSNPLYAADCEDPDVLTFSIIPTEETIQELSLYKPVIDYLSKKTGKKIEFYIDRKSVV